MKRWFVCLAFLAGCNGATGHMPQEVHDLTISFGPGPDLSVPPDLAPPPDLTPEPDLAGPAFCAGTPVDGTCAQGYFAAVTKCYSPTGPCKNNMPTNGAVNACWQSGASFSATYDMVSMMAHGIWKQLTTTCMTADVMTANGKPVFHFTTPGGKLVYDSGTGAVTCPDGSKANIGPQYGMCDALGTLVGVPMNNCTMGPCP